MRVKFNYDRLISICQLESEFRYYCFCHKKIKSMRRLKRAFLLSKGFRKQDFIDATNQEEYIKNAIEIVKVKWI